MSVLTKKIIYIIIKKKQGGQIKQRERERKTDRQTDRQTDREVGWGSTYLKARQID